MPPAIDPATESEHQVLGALIGACGTFEVIASVGLQASHFNSEAHAQIFAAADEVHQAGRLVDLVSVLEVLRARGLEERCGGYRYLEALGIGCASPGVAALHAERVKSAARARQVRQLGERLQRQASAQVPAAELEEIVAESIRGLESIRSGRTKGEGVAFSVVPVADLQATEDKPQQWCWRGYVPAGHVTLWTGHGGVGKSLLVLMLLVSMAMGRPFMGQATTQCRCLFFSAEDAARTVRHRLRRICREWNIDPAELAERLHIIDATDLDAALYVEQRAHGVRHGATTPAYAALLSYVEAEAIDVVAVDNASDVFDGDEIVRTLVRGFVRSLAQMVRPRDGAVILLAHVDKSTSRAGKNAGRESYSGSTAWHNSSRSLITLLEKEPGLLELQHQKCNLGPRQAAVLIRWPEGELPAMELAPLPGEEQPQRNAIADMRGLVALVREYYARGEWVSTSAQSRANAARLLSGEARYPRHLKPAQVLQLLREAQRAKYLQAEDYRGDDRKPRQRWRVTEAGAAMVDDLPLFARGGDDEHGA